MVVTDDLRRRIRQEHNALCALREDMQDSFETWCQDPSTANQESLQRVLHDFSQTLLRHFDFEEQGGYMQTVTDRRPHHAAQVDRLMAEHKEMRGALQDLEAALRSEMENDKHRQELFRRDFAEMYKLFGRHEQAERELVMDVFWLEGGGSD